MCIRSQSQKSCQHGPSGFFLQVRSLVADAKGLKHDDGVEAFVRTMGDSCARARAFQFRLQNSAMHGQIFDSRRCLIQVVAHGTSQLQLHQTWNVHTVQGIGPLATAKKICIVDPGISVNLKSRCRAPRTYTLLCSSCTYHGLPIYKE